MIVDVLSLMEDCPASHKHGADAEFEMATILAPLIGVDGQTITVTEGFFPEYDVLYSGGTTVEFKFSTTNKPVIEISRERTGNPCGLSLTTADYTIYVCAGDAGIKSPIKVTNGGGRWVDMKVHIIPTDWLRRFYKRNKNNPSKMKLTEFGGVSYHLKTRAFPNRFFAGRIKPILNDNGNVCGFDTSTFIPNPKFSIEAL